MLADLWQRLWSGLAITGTNTYNSGAMDMGGRSLVQFMVTTVGTLTGTLVAQGSNSTDQEHAAGAGVWEADTTTELVGVGATNTSGSFAVTNGQVFGVRLKDCGWRKIRLSWTHATGNGTISADGNAKVR